MGESIFEPDFWTQRIKIPLYGHTFWLIYLLTIKVKNRKSHSGVKRGWNQTHCETPQIAHQVLTLLAMAFFWSYRSRDLSQGYAVFKIFNEKSELT